MLTHRTWTG